MKNYFPFRVGTTSLIFNDTILQNVYFLKDKVDHIELFTDETGSLSPRQSNDSTKELIEIANDNDLTYSVHLPIGLKLGSPDKQQRFFAIEAILKAVEATHQLNPLAWDLHLEENYPGEILGEAWQEACISSLEELKRNGVDPACTGIETLEFDYEPIVPILDQTDFTVTLDIGHVWYGSLPEDYFLEKIMPRAVNFHLHGCNNHRDHKGLHTVEENRIKRFLETLYAQPNLDQRSVSIEVFSPYCLEWSLDILISLNRILKFNFPDIHPADPKKFNQACADGDR